VVPTIVEKRNFAALNWCLDYFTDIPEPLVITILTLLLSSIEKTEMRMRRKSSSSGGEEESDKETPIPAYPSNRQINQVLDRPFEQRQMIRSFRSMEFQHVKKFLEYLYCRLEASWDLNLEDPDENTSRISNLIKWICTIFDAHYPQFVFHSETEIVESLLSLMEEKSKVMRDIEGLEPLLVSSLAKVSFQPNPSPHSKFRTETALFD